MSTALGVRTIFEAVRFLHDVASKRDWKSGNMVIQSRLPAGLPFGVRLDRYNTSAIDVTLEGADWRCQIVHLLLVPNNQYGAVVDLLDSSFSGEEDRMVDDLLLARFLI